MGLRTLLRTWLGCLIGCLPLLALLLVPQLMRSRAGSEPLLLLGIGMLLAMLVGAFLLSPLMSAWLARVPHRWEPKTAWAATGVVWRRRTVPAALALLASVAIYAGGQAIGYGLAEVVPYVRENPAHAANPDLSPWVIHYPAYALQAVLLYAVTTLAVAFYAWRIRTLALRSAQAVNSATTSPAATAR